MAVARSNTVVEGERCVYHCMARCVRQAFLCGEDPYTGENYDHRKEWIRERIYDQIVAPYRYPGPFVEFKLVYAQPE